MARNYKPNEAGFRELGLSPGVRRVLAEIAGNGKRFAETIAPYDATEDGEDKGHYKDSFVVVEETILQFGKKHPGPRAAARVLNQAGYAAAVEYGYKGRAADEEVRGHRVLGRTLDYLESEGKA